MLQPFGNIGLLRIFKSYVLAIKVKKADLIVNLNDNPSNKQIVEFAKHWFNCVHNRCGLIHYYCHKTATKTTDLINEHLICI